VSRPVPHPFDAVYRGVPPWEIGRPQPEFVRLAAKGAIAGRVLDAGCGTGENALHLAGLGLEVVGVDASSVAIGKARAKARRRGSGAAFVHGDALELAGLGQTFDAAIDCGLFHTFGDRQRPRYAASLAAVLRPGGLVHLLCFSEYEPGDWGPRRVTQGEIRSTFAGAWEVEAIRAARFETLLGADPVRAWLATIRRRHARR